jgi:hypothetical protein
MTDTKTFTFLQYMAEYLKKPDMQEEIVLMKGSTPEEKQLGALNLAMNVALHDAICGGTNNPFFTIKRTLDGEVYVDWILLDSDGWNFVVILLEKKMEPSGPDKR